MEASKQTGFRLLRPLPQSPRRRGAQRWLTNLEQEDSFEPLHPGKLLQAVADEVSPLAQERQVSITVNASPLSGGPGGHFSFGTTRSAFS